MLTSGNYTKNPAWFQCICGYVTVISISYYIFATYIKYICLKMQFKRANLTFYFIPFDFSITSRQERLKEQTLYTSKKARKGRIPQYNQCCTPTIQYFHTKIGNLTFIGVLMLSSSFFLHRDILLFFFF